ncbi:hypothetical protein BC938DRAFT_479111 [Jimgerdemannia flammicorona]|uniref:Uncharacterized protein n=1 Tax=Jimgerdemannia flammicorona TaxID=994334 RepID=A0A433QLK9_9FUNG|nr:hypothetical protein BC938DRAFT_479111 [Jimgerdemannia flammicorona]
MDVMLIIKIEGGYLLFWRQTLSISVDCHNLYPSRCTLAIRIWNRYIDMNSLFRLVNVFINLLPGGWVELLEFDAKVQQSGPTYDLIRDSLNRTCLSRGIDLSICQHLDQLCTELECVQSESLTTPLRGRRGREAVESMRLFMMAIWERIAPEMGVRKEEYQQMMAQAVNEFSDNHAWMRMWCVYGMKPSR